MRKDGYYFVKLNDGWTIANWSDNSWTFVGNDETFYDDSGILQIGDKIKMPDDSEN